MDIDVVVVNKENKEKIDPYSVHIIFFFFKQKLLVFWYWVSQSVGRCRW